MAILRRHVVNESGSNKPLGLRKAVIEFLALPGIKRFLSKFDRSRQTLFMHYCLLYLKIYQSSCAFEINVTDRYPSRAKDEDEEEEETNEPENKPPQSSNEVDESPRPHLEGCVVSKQLIRKGEHVQFLDGWLASLEDDVDQTFKGETDFSIIHTSRNGNANLLLGPARFVNHDCNPNCSFSRKGKKISLRATKNIHPGQELTVTYAKNYFGYRNRECRCVTCEIQGVNGFGPPNEYPSDDDSSDTDFLTKLKRRNRKPYRLSVSAVPESLLCSGDHDAVSSPVVASDPVDSESTPQSSRSPSAGVDVDTPATSIEPDSVDSAPLKSDSVSDVPLKRRLRRRDGFISTVEDKLFKFSFDEDDENFSNTREEWKTICRGLTKEDRDIYTFHDYIFRKLSDLDRYKDLQRFYFSSPIDADPDLTLDCVNCGTPFFGPDDRVAPRRLPTRLCPRCHRHAIIFNAYWPSVEPLNEKIELLRAWDFTSLKDIGVRGEFVPPDDKKKKTQTKRSKSVESDVDDTSESETESEYDSDKDHRPLTLKRKHPILKQTAHRSRPTEPKRRSSRTIITISLTDSDSDREQMVARKRTGDRRSLSLSRLPHSKSQTLTYGRTSLKMKSNSSIRKSNILPDSLPRKRGRPKRSLPEESQDGRKLDDSPDDESEDDSVTSEVPQPKKKYGKRVDKEFIGHPRRSARLSLDPLEDNTPFQLTRSGRRGTHSEILQVKRPLYIVPLNANKPTCILLPPSGNSDDELSFTGEFPTVLPSAQPQSFRVSPPRRPLRSSASLGLFPIDKSAFDFPCVTAPPMPTPFPILVSDLPTASRQSSEACKDDQSKITNDQLNNHSMESPKAVPTLNTCRHPKTKTFGLNAKSSASVIYTTPSWKLLQDIQSS